MSSGPFDGWLPVRGLAAVLAAGRMLLPTTPAGVLEAAVRTAAEVMRGRRVTVRAADYDVPMTVVDLACTGDTVRLAQGRIDSVRFVAREVGWPAVPLAHLAVTCRDLRFAGPLSATVTAGSVRLDVSVTADAVRARLAEERPDLSVRFGTGLFVSRKPWPGELEVVPEVADDTVRLRPLALWVAGRRLPLPTRVRPVVLPVPDLPRGLRLTSITATPDGLDLRGDAENWRDRLSGTPLTELVSLLATAATTLTVGR
ncbi:LmeA family phospholipid-binding protein [Actinokineospora sp.]|uniref:LmeA family phospholipid-binding protein n=1 Tax=Actinokineospora sp. TaxID=1872133 RepID=UPI004037C47E